MKNIFKEVRTEIKFVRTINVDYFAHIHEDIEIVFVKRGSVTAFCDGKKHQLSDNMCFLTAPYQVHHYTDCDTKGEYILLVIKPSQLLRYGDIFASGAPQTAIYQFDGDDNGVLEALEAALDEFNTEGTTGIMDGYFAVFFGKLLKFYQFEKGKTQNDTVRQIIKYCIDHYRENISISDIANELGVSRSCVSHIFSSRFAINFCDYINSLRLMDSVQLLKNSVLSVTDIALISGFSNLRTFNRAFLKQYGVTPTGYRMKFSTQKVR